MKKILLSKWVIFLLMAVVVISMFAGCESKQEREEETYKFIEETARHLLVYPEITKAYVDEFVTAMNEIKGDDEKTKIFEERALHYIRNINNRGTGGAYLQSIVHDITAPQILLEAADYKSEALRDAFNAKSLEMLAFYEECIDYEDFIEAIMVEPYKTEDQEEKIYDTKLTYYTNTQTVFLNDYLPKQLETQKANAMNTKDTGKLLSLCYDLAALTQYPNFDVDALIDINEVLNILSADAERISIREGEGGQYDGFATKYSSHTDANGFKCSTVTKYYGDLADVYEDKIAPRPTGEDWENEMLKDYDNSWSYVLVKDEKIDKASVNTQHLKYAREEGMVNYHKDGYCFAVSDSALVCYVGGDPFIFYFS